MKDRVRLLTLQLDEAYFFLRERLEGLTDEEFFWEPAPGCWTVRRLPDGRWAADYAEPDPDPPPLTTIGWRLVHVAECKLMYREYAFGPGKLTWDRIDSAHTAKDAIASLEEWHRALAADVYALDDSELDELRPTNWGERWPLWRIVWTMVHHDLHHGGEIGVLRDLYRNR